ncbi:MAG: undecaprenyldiphospho-muramoylpentapeptide beta-N-acetylglucosaminyltransferase [Firmicutes bacterium]|nr:undecaprenyldiphospho-muramoylpentapeptide beta-N-acetylglucosaminyltransferase [Bacillota bacterium]
MRVVISGGGTAGHIYPGLALAKALQKIRDDLEIVYIGTSSGLESTLVPQAGLTFKAVEARGLPRKPSFKALATVFSAGWGTLESINILKGFKPDVVVGMGAYVSLPVVGAAVLRQIPTVIHEQNAVPGLVNRVLGKVATAIAVSYPDMSKYFPSGKKVEFTGNPVREEILQAKRSEAVKNFKIDKARKVLLVFGGSRGAKRINEAVVEAYDEWRAREDLQIVHATGNINYGSVKEAIEKIKSPKDTLLYNVYPYIDNIGEAYAIADLLVCRSGATTVAEITAKGLPAILIPYPYATDNHQEKNGRQLEKLGAARVILDHDLNGRLLAETVTSLISDEDELLRMSGASKQFGQPNAADVLAKLVLKVANTHIEIQKSED